jgi:AcrR family transcriptional regulator
MPRIVKHPELRRSELADRAQALILERGYDNVSLNEIIVAAGVSKGAFYHYFPSKEALLEALAGRFAEAALSHTQEVLDAPGLDALTRLNALLTKIRQNKKETARKAWTIFEVLLRPENFLLFHRINLASNARFAPILTGLIKQGVAEGRFDTFDPEGVATLVLQLGAATHDLAARVLRADSAEDMHAAFDALELRIKLYEIAIDRVLGLPDGSVHLVEPGYMREVMMMPKANPSS